MQVLRLESSQDDGVFELNRAGKHWQVTLALRGLRAATEVDGTAYGFGEGLAAYFRRIADDWRGWDGGRGWESLEGEFALQATHDGLGYVKLRVWIRGGLYEEDWNADGTIWIDAGQLEAVARAAKRFDATI